MQAGSSPLTAAARTQVVCQLAVAGDDRRLAAGVKLRPPRAPKDLLHIQHAQVGERAALGVVHLAAVAGGCGVRRKQGRGHAAESEWPGDVM